MSSLSARFEEENSTNSGTASGSQFSFSNSSDDPDSLFSPVPLRRGDRRGSVHALSDPGVETEEGKEEDEEEASDEEVGGMNQRGRYSPTPGSLLGPTGTAIRRHYPEEDTPALTCTRNLANHFNTPTPFTVNDETSQLVQKLSFCQACRRVIAVCLAVGCFLALVVAGNKLSMLDNPGGFAITPDMANSTPNFDHSTSAAELNATWTSSSVPAPFPNGTWTIPNATGTSSSVPAPVPNLDPIQSSEGNCSQKDFQGECITTGFCESIYATAEDCKISEGGVCYCARDEVCGCM